MLHSPEHNTLSHALVFYTPQQSHFLITFISFPLTPHPAFTARVHVPHSVRADQAVCRVTWWLSKIVPQAGSLMSKQAADFPRYFAPLTAFYTDEMRWSSYSHGTACTRSSWSVSLSPKDTKLSYSLTLVTPPYFLCYSRSDSIVDDIPIRGWSPTSPAVVHLARTLPHPFYWFNIH